VESWIRAETVNIVSVSETLASGRALVRFEIQNAPVKEFRVRVPATLTNVEIFGPNIRRRDQTNDVWRVELQNKVRGDYTLTVTWEQRRAATNALLEVAGVEAPGVERETGSVVVMARPPLQVTEKSATDQLIKIDVRELPDWAGVSATAAAPGGEVPALVYRYLRPGYKLALEARRYQDANVLQALIESARLTTVVADDGQMMTEMTLGVRNNGKQHLEIELPPRTVVWSAFVAGQPVRPSRNGGKLMLPLERSSGDETPVTVELTYIGQDEFPKRKGIVRLLSPQLDVPLKNARWDLYLPPDYDYTKFEGSMAHEAEATPVVQVYSSTEYFRQEETKKNAKKTELKNYLGNVRSSLASGKLSGANSDFNQALRFNDRDGDGVTKQELEGLKRDLGRAQSSNLINAQRAWTYDNASKYGDTSGAQPAGGKGGGQQAQQAAELVAYDTESAEQQWGALQRAQEVSVAKVQPLRANLPTRGQRLSFSQVLQTEVNKPMTIQLTATNAKDVGWFKQLLYLVAGFLMLWIFVSTVSNRSKAGATAT
jgi:hypothetical protein